VIPEGMRAVSVRVNEVVGVAGYVLPGNRVDVVATASPTEQRADTTSKVVLSNVQVLTAGTRMEQGQDQSKPVQVTVVTLLVYPEQAERLALASTEGKIQLALRNPLDQGAPTTPGIKTSGLMGSVAAPARQSAGASRPRAAQPVTQSVPAAAPMPTVEMIRGDKRATEVIR
jgi:pilus assembly protein CpaB